MRSLAGLKSKRCITPKPVGAENLAASSPSTYRSYCEVRRAACGVGAGGRNAEFRNFKKSTSYLSTSKSGIYGKQPMEARAKREASLDAGKRKLEEFRRKKVERQKLAKAATVTIEDPPLGEDTNGGAPRAAVPHASIAVLPSHGPEGKPPREHAQEVQHAQAGSLAA